MLLKAAQRGLAVVVTVIVGLVQAAHATEPPLPPPPSTESLLPLIQSPTFRATGQTYEMDTGYGTQPGEHYAEWLGVIAEAVSESDRLARNQSLLNESATLAALTPTGTVTIAGQRVLLTGDCELAQQVFTLNAAAIPATAAFEVACVDAEDDVVINVTGSELALSGKQRFEGMSWIIGNVVFNVPTATSVDLNGVRLYGRLLAPVATLDEPVAVVAGAVDAKRFHAPLTTIEDVARYASPVTQHGDCQAPQRFSFASQVTTEQEFAEFTNGIKIVAAVEAIHTQTPPSDHVAHDDFTSIKVVQDLLGLGSRYTYSDTGTPPPTDDALTGNDSAHYAETLLLRFFNTNDEVITPRVASVTLPHAQPDQFAIGIRNMFEDEVGMGGEAYLNRSMLRLGDQDNAQVWIGSPGSDFRADYAIKLRAIQDGHFAVREIGYEINRNPELITVELPDATVGVPYRIHLLAEDSDCEPVFFYVVSGPEGIDAHWTAGKLTWSNPVVGTHTIEIQVSDSAAGASNFTLELHVLPDSSGNHPPVITSSPQTGAVESQLWEYATTATDEDNDVLTFYLTQSPSGMMIDAATGNVSWTPTFTNEGNHSVTVEVRDGRGGVAQQTFVIAVSDTNHPPAITSQPIISVNENAAYHYPVIAEDADGDTLTYTLLHAPERMTIDAQTGVVAWAPAFDEAGTYDIEVQVADPHGEIVTQSFTLTVVDVNRPPIITSASIDTATESVLYAYRVEATDADDDVLSYALLVYPSGMTIDASSGEIYWTPTFYDVGTHTVAVAVTDANNASVSQAYTLTVSEVSNRAPEITSEPVLVGIESNTYTYAVTTSDPDADTVSVALLEGPDGMHFDATTNSIIWEEPEVGIYPVRLSATDSEGLSDEQTYQLQIVAVQPPVTTQGNDFWLMFNRQPSSDARLLLYVSAATSANVTISIDGLNYQSVHQVAANSVTTVDLRPLNPGFMNPGISNNGVHVTADVPISLYLINYRKTTSDAALVLPAQALGYEYRAMSYAARVPNSLGAINFGNFIGVIATEDNTTVRILSKVRIYETTTNSSSPRPADVPFEITLNRGQTYQGRVDGGYATSGQNITGASVIADKPIALFSGDQCASVKATYCNHLVEQIPPINSWASEYMTLPFATRKLGDTFRILASADQTYISINGSFVALLNAGEFYETLIEGPSRIVGTKPILVAQFSNGATFDSDVRTTGNFADPFMILVPPADQFLSIYNITTPAEDFNANYVNLLVPSESRSTVRIDGIPIEEDLWVDIPYGDFVAAQIPVAIGQHNLTADQPFGLYVYGYDSHDAYGYLGGMALSEQKIVSDMDFSADVETPPAGSEICVNARLFDPDGYVAAQQQVHFKRHIGGIAQDYSSLTDITGVAQYCFIGATEGQETVEAFSRGLSRSLQITWQPKAGGGNLPPQIVSMPNMFVIPGQPYQYQVIARDPEFSPLQYTLMENPGDMSIDQDTGLISWIRPTALSWITVQVSDGQFSTTQRYRLSSAPGANNFPIITSDPPVFAIAGRTFIYNMNATDFDGDQLFYRLVSGPQNVSINGRTLSWIPSSNDIGIEIFTVEVSDDSGYFDTQTFFLDVRPNLLPQFTSTPLTSAITAHRYSYRFEAEDDNGDIVAYRLVSGPEGMTHVAGYRTLEWTPSISQVGSHQVVVEADDRFGGSTQQNFTIIVRENAVPIFASTPPLTAIVGHTYRYNYAVSDPDGDPVNLSSNPAQLIAAPTGVTTGSFIGWVPSANQVGQHQVQIRWSDNFGGFAVQTFTINVQSNQQPSFTSSPNVNAVTQHAYLYRLQGSDGDGDTLTFSLLSGPSGMIVRRASTGYQVEWTPSAQQVGIHNVVIALSDGSGGIVQQTYSINVSANRGPNFTSKPNYGGRVGSYHYTLVAVDPEGDYVNYRLISGPGGMQLTAWNLNWSPTASQVGISPVVVEAYDQFGAATQQQFNVTVTNNTLEFTHLPANPHIVNDELYSFRIEAVHPSTSAIQFSLTQAPSGMTINSSSGLLQWTPALSQLGTHTISVHASALGLENNVTFAMQVSENTNTAPVITSQPITTAVVATAYSYPVIASDAENHAITYTLPGAPSGMSISSAGVINWTPSASQDGPHAVTIRATDERGRFSEQSFTVTVQVNHAPELNGTPQGSAAVGHDYTATLPVIDVDGDDLIFGVISAPSGFGIDSVTGFIHWTPATNHAGVQPVSVSVSDGTLTIVVNWLIQVDANVIPLNIDIGVSPQTIEQNAQTAIHVQTKGGVAQPTVQLLVDGVIVPMTSQLRATVMGTTVGRHEVAVTANDGVQTQTAYSWFGVADPADTTPPTVELLSPASGASITAPTDILGTVQDEHLAEVKLLFRRTDSDDWVEIYNGSAAFDEQVIAQFDPTQLVNGLYHILLEATDANGQKSSDAIAVVVDGDLKVGNFSFTVQDLTVPVSGMPVRVTRSYDSRRRDEPLDFGYGWSVGYQDVRIEESSEPTQGWQQLRRSLSFTVNGAQVTVNATCTYPLNDKTVTVTLPDGQVERFSAYAAILGGGNISDSDPDCYMVGGRYHDLRFRPEGDTQSTLMTTSGSNLYLTSLSNGNLGDIAESTPWPISRYRLTTRAGYIYDLNQNFGIEKVTDPNGNTLTYSNTGIVHSSGLSVLFNRDTQGRITSITDPAGVVVMTYSYNSAGDLVSATDALTARTQYTYNREHGLIDIIDPLNRNVVKNIYDDDGRLIAQEDNAGNRREFDHNLTGRQSVVTDRNGHATVFHYDNRGNVLSKQDALSGTTQYTYDTDDNQLTETNALGHTKTATYNSHGDQLTQTDAEGHTVSFAYNARGQETLVTDARGNVYEQTYDTVGNLLSIEDPAGNTAGNWIDGQGQVTRTRDLEGHDTQYTYDTRGNKLTETDALGVVTTYTYDANNNKRTQTRSRTLANGSSVSEVTTYEYDARNRLIRTTDALGYVTRSEYDLAGNAIALIDAKNRRTETDYDAYGRVTQVRYPDGSSDSKTYDDEGNLLTETDRAGRTTTFEYDELNRLVLTTYPDGAQTETEYDAAGRVEAEVDARGHRTEFEYDRTGKRTAVIDALGHRHEVAYDASGNVITTTDALDRDTVFTWNALDQKTLTHFANNNTVGNTFDALGRKLTHTDEAGITTTYQYDALGRLTVVTDVQGNVTAYAYDEAGNKIRQTDAEGRITRWSYDALGRVTSRTLPLGQSESFSYDATGNEISHTDFNGNVTTRTYYANNDRLHTVTYHDGSSESYTYTASGQVQTVTQNDTSGIRVTSNLYDARDRLQQQTQPDGTVLVYQYDGNGNRIQVSITRNNATYVTTSVYDVLNRLVQVTDAEGTITTYTYDAAGNRESETKANGNRVGYVYDERNRLEQLTHYAANNSVQQQFSYTLHPTGRRSQIDEASGRTTVYGYDTLYRLISETITDTENGNYSATYEYDDVGNRTSETIDSTETLYTVDANDRLTSKGASTYTYDANGNTLTSTEGGVTTTYTYGARNVLLSVTNTGGTTSFRYNVAGIRTAKTQGATTTSFVVDENRDYAQVLLETDGTNETRYTYGDDLLSQRRDGETHFFHYDGLGSTRALSNEAGEVSDTYDYAAFGEELSATGATENQYRFTGEQFDETLNQYYLRARYYNPAVGRFTSQDSWQGDDLSPITLHKYAYANVDPVNGIDPSGHMNLAEQMTIVQSVTIHSVAAQARFAIGAAANDAAFTTTATALTSKEAGLLAIAAMGATGMKLYQMLGHSQEDDRDNDDEPVVLYHGTSSNMASIIVREGFRNVPVFFAEDFNWARTFAATRAGANGSSNSTVIEFTIPEKIADVTITYRGQIGAYWDMPLLDGMERVMDSEGKMHIFNGALMTGQIQSRRLR